MPQPPPNSWKNPLLKVIAHSEHLLRGRNPLKATNAHQIRNFLVLQLESPLGSVVHATPLFQALKLAAPNAHVTVATSAMAQEVLDLNPYIDRCVRVPSPFESFRATRTAIRDLLNSMPPGLCCIITTVGNQRTRVAFLDLLGEKCFRAGYTLAPQLYNFPLFFDPEHGQIESNLDILRSLGHAIEFSEPQIFFSQEEADYANGLLKHLADSADPRIVFVTQNSGGQRNRWSDERFIQVIRQLTDAVGAHPIFVATYQDVSAIESIRQQLQNPGISAAGQTSVRQLAALLAQCDLAVSLDTGTFHVARAVGLPGVVIAPAWQSSREWLPMGDVRYRILQGPRIPAPPPDYWIAEISTEQVIQAALDLLDQFPSSIAERTARTRNSLSSVSALRQ